MSRQSSKREQLKEQIDKNKVLELFVCSYSVAQIAAELDYDDRYIEQVLANSLAEFFTQNQEYAERAALMNLAKLRALTRVWLPKALDGNISAAQLMLKIITTEDNIAAKLEPVKEVAGNVVESVQKFEQTFTSTDPRYAIAIQNLNQSEDNHSIFSLPEFEKVDNSPPLLDDSTEILRKIHEKHANLVEKFEEDDDDL